ncbi:MAG: nuclear transport factor 2 family protein [Planctomycetes bacterium]|nr:nuclear transport factor 2 family protein [Planctomycetota bacterium]
MDPTTAARRGLKHLAQLTATGGLLACLSVAGGCATASSDVAPRLTAILADQQNAWNRGDIDGFMQHYWRSDELSFSSGGKMQHGWQTTLDRYRRTYPTPERMGTLEFNIDQVRPLGSAAALLLGRWHLTRADPVGGNFSLVFQRIDDRWVIVHDHTSVLESDDP